jgi:3-polyprenyl-4-hydroxybenzoate decarboxylase
MAGAGADAIYPATVVGKPRQEDFFIGDLLQDCCRRSSRWSCRRAALWSYGETGYHSLAAAVVRERYRREAMASAFRILGEGQLSLTKFLLVTDRAVDLKDFKATLQHVLARTGSKLMTSFVFSNVSMDTLDYTGPRVNEGSKGVWLGLGRSRCGHCLRSSGESCRKGVSEALVFCPGMPVLGGPAVRGRPGPRERIRRTSVVSRPWPLLS